LSMENNELKKPEELKYNNDGLIPAIIQDIESKEVLMMAYMNVESLKKTLETGLTWFWSRSRSKFWQKGESSGHIQEVQSIHYDCDADTLLIKVKQTGVACHTGNYSCFFNPMELKTGNKE
jgi:phosphoribosyl-AMP cyclohydrolase